MTVGASRITLSGDPEGVTVVEPGIRTSALEWVLYLLLGSALGVLFVTSQVLSWYRIQEMFRFHSFHMYGVIASAVVVAGVSIWAMRRYEARTMAGAEIRIPAKQWTKGAYRYWQGGFVFGLGWALLGACPGPIFTLIGAGETVFVVPLVSAVAGTLVYGYVNDRLPH
jgi:hypothetical protein